METHAVATDAEVPQTSEPVKCPMTPALKAIGGKWRQYSISSHAETVRPIMQAVGTWGHIAYLRMQSEAGTHGA